MSMKWKHTLVFAVVIAAVGGSVFAVAPLKTSSQQWTKASADAGQCPSGIQAYDCMDDRSGTPTWHYQDGGTSSMVSATVSVPSGQIPYGTGSGITSGTNLTWDSSYLILYSNTIKGDNSAGLNLYDQYPSPQSQIVAGNNTYGLRFWTNGTTYLFRMKPDGGFQIPSSTAAPCVGCLRYNSGTSALQYSNDGSTWNNVGSGGGGIGGSIAATQIPVGNGTNTVQGSNNLTADTSGNVVAAGSVTTPKTVSTVADSSTSVAHIIDTTHSYATLGDELVSWRNNGTELMSMMPGIGAGAVTLGGGASSTAVPLLDFENGILYFYYRAYDYVHAASPLFYIGNAYLNPYSDNTFSLGSTSSRRIASVASYWYDMARGAQVTAAASITPTSALHHVTGSTSITTIATTNLPSSGNVALKLICDVATCNYGTGGNIGATGSWSQNTFQEFVYDATSTTWYPQ